MTGADPPRVAVVLLVLLASAACRTAQGSSEDRACVVHPTRDGRDAIARVANRTIPGVRVILDDDAVSDDGVRVIDPSQLHDAPWLAIDGRGLSGPGRAERFHLVKRGEHCLLVHDRTDRSYELIGTICAAR